jgi:RNA polymerase sigma factor (TIGR02999 family)
MATDQLQAVDEQFRLVYDHLRALAHRMRHRAGRDATLETTALVHEAYLKLVHDRDRPWDRAHFLAVVSRAIRQVLINEGERKRAQKRGGALRQTTLEGLGQAPDVTEELLTLDRALRELERKHPRLGQVVECRFFGGLTLEETADALSTSPATVKRDWRLAQAFLHRELCTRDRGSGRASLR